MRANKYVTRDMESKYFCHQEHYWYGCEKGRIIFIAKDDPKARFPAMNFTDIVPKELSQDCYSSLVLQGRTNEVSILDVGGKV